MPCQKSTIYFTYIAWLNEEAKTQLLATRIARSHWCQRLVEQQAAVGKTKRIAGIQLAFWRSEVIIVISSPHEILVTSKTDNQYKHTKHAFAPKTSTPRSPILFSTRNRNQNGHSLECCSGFKTVRSHMIFQPEKIVYRITTIVVQNVCYFKLVAYITETMWSKYCLAKWKLYYNLHCTLNRILSKLLWRLAGCNWKNGVLPKKNY